MRWVARIAIALVVIVIIAVGAVELYTASSGFHRYLRDKLVSVFDAGYRGKMTVGAVGGSLWQGFSVRDAAVTIDGRRVIKIARLKVQLSLIPLLWREVYIKRLVAEQPSIDMRRSASGRWDLAEAFAERPPVRPSSLSVTIARLELKNTRARVAAAAGESYTLDNGQLLAGVYIGPHQTRLRVRHLAGTVGGPRLPALELDASFVLGVQNSGLSLAEMRADLNSQESVLKLRGSVANFRRGPYDLSADLTRLGAADLARITSMVHLAHHVTGKLKLRGAASSLKAELRLAAGKAFAAAAVKADLSGHAPHYDADIHFSGVKPGQFAPQLGLAGTIEGRWHLYGGSLTFATLQAKGQLAAKNVRWRGYNVGDLETTATLRNRAVNCQGQISGSGGNVSYTAEVALAGTPNYKLSVQVAKLNPSRIAPNVSAPFANLNFKLEVSGKGAFPAHMNAQVALEVSKSQAGSLNIAGGQAEAAIAGGYLDLRRVVLKADGAAANLSGRIKLAKPASGQVDYALESANIAPLLKLVGRSGSGAVNLRGKASGSLSDLTANGAISLRQASFASVAIAQGRLDYDLEGIGTEGGLRQGRIDAKVLRLKAGVLWQELTTQVVLQGTQGMVTADLKLAAQYGEHRHARLDSAVTYRQGKLTGRIEHLSFALADGEWSLPQPASIELEGGRVSIAGFALSHRDSRLTLAGTVAVKGAQNLQLALTDLPLSAVQAQLGRRVPVAGLLSAHAHVAGSAAAPLIDAAIDVKTIEIAGARYAGLQARVDYGARAARLSATLAQDARHSLNLQGALPISLGWAGGWRFEMTGPADIHVSSSGLSLAFLNALSPSSVGRISGLLAVEVTASGPINKLTARGSLELKQAGFEANALGLIVTGLEARVAFEPGRIELTRLAAKADHGSLRASGNITLDGMMPQQVTLKTSLEQWPAINTARYRARVAGNLDVAGPLRRLAVNGSLQVESADIRPNLAFVSGGLTQVDRTIRVIRPSTGAQAQVPAPKPLRNLPTFRSLAMQLKVDLGPDSWIRQGQSSAQITGNLVVAKASYREITVSGTVKVVRGSVIVANQHFTLSNSQIVFAGGHPIDPLLDVSAEKHVPGYVVTAQITGTARKPSLALRSQPDLPQSQILSLLLFGTPVQNLSGSQKQTLQEQATAMAAGFATSQLAHSVAQALGLEGFGVSVQGGAIGINVTPGLYLSAGQDVSGTSQGGKAAIDYDLTRHLQLRTSTSTVNGNQIELRWQTNY